MRERLAKVFAALLTALVVLMAAFFAWRRNEAPPPTNAETAQAVPPAPLDAAMVARGREVYEEQACARCHSVAGAGNPRSPLDGIGGRLVPMRLLEALTGTGPYRDRFTRSVVRTKEGFGRLPAEDLSAVVFYLSSLR